MRKTPPLSRLSSRMPIICIREGTFYRKYPSGPDQDKTSNPAIFPGLTWSLPSIAARDAEQQHWAVIGPSNAGKTTFLDVIRGQHLCIPPAARAFPYLSTIEPTKEDSHHRNILRAIKYVGFDGEKGVVGGLGTRGAYLSERYESRREATDFSVMDFLGGNTDLNPLGEQKDKAVNSQSLDRVISDLKLEALVNRPLRNLSNGQTRRTRIAKALIGKPVVLLLDEPFMGLDPPTVTALIPCLERLAKASSLQIILTLRPQDSLPGWITHVIHVGSNCQIIHQGRNGPASRGVVRATANIWPSPLGPLDVPEEDIPQKGLIKVYSWRGLKSRNGVRFVDKHVPISTDEALVEMQDVRVHYGDKEVLGSWEQEIEGQTKLGLSWTVRRGERWGVFGPNGSGKTTLISLICSDHPQAYSLPIKVFGRGRLPQPGLPGISIFDIQSRIGQSSPEIHTFFPRNLSIRRTLETAWADTFLGRPSLNYENDVAVDACLQWFEADLNPAFTPLTTKLPVTRRKSDTISPNSVDWADNIRFGDIPFSAQRVALFLRAIIKKPDVVVLDEAFSGMDHRMRDKCMLFLTYGETKSFGFHKRNGVLDKLVYKTSPVLLSEPSFEGLSKDQALICVSHVKEEVPGVVRQWMSLPEAGTGNAARFGTFRGPLDGEESDWDQVWGVQ